MSMRLTRWAYESLVAEDIAWLKTMPRTLERDHILMILNEAVRYEYDNDRDKAIAEGRRLERAAIVADLRAMLSIARLADLRDLADRYERGEHEEGK